MIKFVARFAFQMAGIVGSILQAFLILFSGFSVHITDALPSLRWLFYITYLRYVFEGSIDAIYGYDRPKLQCKEIYCHFQIPAKFIREVDMQRNDFYSASIILASILVIYRVLAFLVIAWRLDRK